ncbi:MAG: hypothetical protein WCL14_00220 [Bacteroidota bacterium]
MRKILLLTLLYLSSNFISNAQPTPLLKDTVGVFYQKLEDSINKIVDDFPSNFNHIRGEKVATHTFYSAWQSIANIPGFEHGIIFMEPGNSYEHWVYKALLISSENRETTLNSYYDQYLKLRQIKLHCCVTQLSEDIDYLGDYNATWKTLMLHNDKDKAFKKLMINLRYHESTGSATSDVYLYIQSTDD